MEFFFEDPSFNLNKNFVTAYRIHDTKTVKGLLWKFIQMHRHESLCHQRMNLLNWIFRSKQMFYTQNECNRKNFHCSGPMLVMGFVIVIRNEWEVFCCARAVARLSPNGICLLQRLLDRFVWALLSNLRMAQIKWLEKSTIVSLIFLIQLPSLVIEFHCVLSMAQTIWVPDE